MDSTVRLFPAFLLLVSLPLGAHVQPGALGAVAGSGAYGFSGAKDQVLFSSLALGFVGLWQVNATVPASAPSGSSVPVEISMAAAPCNNVNLAVR